jgi:hypothetical protein
MAYNHLVILNTANAHIVVGRDAATRIPLNIRPHGGVGAEKVTSLLGVGTERISNYV